MEIHSIARTLGYLFTYRPYKYPGSCIMDMVTRHMYQSEVDYWSTSSCLLSNKRISDSEVEECREYLILRGICLKCGAKNVVTRDNPFCSSCYISIKSEYDLIPFGCTSNLNINNMFPDKNKRWVYITDYQLKFVQDETRWIESIPVTYKYDTKCIDCNGEPKCIRLTTEYFDGYKQICEHCLNFRMEERGLLDRVETW